MAKLISFSDQSIIIDKITCENNKFIINIHRRKKYYCCPKCNEKTKSVHSYKTRYIQDLPIQNKGVVLVANARLFVCNSCKLRFIEMFETSKNNAQRTDRLDKYILDIAVSNSSINTQNILNKNGEYVAPN